MSIKSAVSGMLALFAVASAANAGIIITMSEAGVAGPTVVANVSGDSAFFFGTFGDYAVSINTAVSNSPGAGNLATLNVSSSETRGVALPGSSGVLSINVEATGFTIPSASTPIFFLQSIGSNSSSSTATATFQSALDGTPAPLQGPLAQGVSDTIVVPFAGPLVPFPFNISNTTTIKVAPGLEGSTSGSTEVSNVPNFQPPGVIPEPASIVTWLLGICGFGALRLRKRLAIA
jgi:hypothetical protein